MFCESMKTQLSHSLTLLIHHIHKYTEITITIITVITEIVFGTYVLHPAKHKDNLSYSMKINIKYDHYEVTNDW